MKSGRRGRGRGDQDRDDRNWEHSEEIAAAMPISLASERERYVSEDVIKFPCVMLTMNTVHLVHRSLRPKTLPRATIRRVIHRRASAADIAADSSSSESDIAETRNAAVTTQVLCTFRTGFLERRTSRRRKNIIIAAGIADATRDFQLLNAVIRTYQRGLQAARDADRDYYMSAATTAVYGGAGTSEAHRHGNSVWDGGAGSASSWVPGAGCRRLEQSVECRRRR